MRKTNKAIFFCLIMIFFNSLVYASPPCDTTPYCIEYDQNQDCVQWENPQNNYGCQIGSFGGAPIYSNGPEDHATGTGFGDPEYQCVALIKRYYWTKDIDLYYPIGQASNYYDEFYDDSPDDGDYRYLRQSGLIRCENDFDHRLTVGDILVFDSGTYGHVALISQINETSNLVSIVEQNVGETTYTRSFSLSTQSGKHQINNNSVLGWLHFAVGDFADGAIENISQLFIDEYNNESYYGSPGRDVFGAVFDNDYHGVWVHEWPDASCNPVETPPDTCNTDGLYVQDFLLNGTDWSQLVLNTEMEEVFPVKGDILEFWHDNTGYSNYGPPTGREYDYIDLSGNSLKLQKFEKNGSIRYIGYNVFSTGSTREYGPEELFSYNEATGEYSPAIYYNNMYLYTFIFYNEGWSTGNNTEEAIGIEPYSWYVQVTGSNPRVLSPEFTKDVNAGDLIVHFRAKITGVTSYAQGNIYVKDETDSWNNSAAFYVTADGNFHDYVVPLSGVYDPDILVKQFSIELTDGNGAPSEYWEFDFVRVIYCGCSTANNLNEINKVLIVSDINSNGHKEMAVLKSHPITGQPMVTVIDSYTGQTIIEVSFMDAHCVLQGFTILPDMNSNGFPEIRVSAFNHQKNEGRYEIRDLKTGEFIK